MGRRSVRRSSRRRLTAVHATIRADQLAWLQSQGEGKEGITVSQSLRNALDVARHHIDEQTDDCKNVAHCTDSNNAD